jgi:Ser/Thr protein kinase RdoA (MazF antagonist)
VSLAATARAALTRYPGLDGARVRLLQHEDNAVYLVVAGSGQRLVLRVAATSGCSEAELRAEATWLTALRQGGLPVPEPVCAADGAAIVLVDGAPCVLLRWLPGRAWPRTGVSASQLALAGDLAARLHCHAERFWPPAGFVRPVWDWPEILGQLDGRLAGDDRRLVEDVGARLAGVLRRAGRERDAFGLIHSDLHRGNLLYHRGRVAGIDFDDCGWGWFAYDLATILSSADRFGAGPRERAACLEAYARVRALPPGADHLAAFVAMREALVLGFVLTSRNPNVAAWGPARVREALDRLRAYSSG